MNRIQTSLSLSSSAVSVSVDSIDACKKSRRGVSLQFRGESTVYDHRVTASAPIGLAGFGFFDLYLVDIPLVQTVAP